VKRPIGRALREEVPLTRTVLVVLLLAAAVSVVHAQQPTAEERLQRAKELIGRAEPALAVPLLREALRANPELPDARATLGFALFGMGDVDGAIEELRAAIRRAPDAIAPRVHLATALMARQDAAGARSELEEVLRRQRDHLQAHFALGVVRYTLGDLAGAIDSYRQLLAIDPRHHDARFHLALTLKLAHRDADATREFLAAAEAGHPRAQYFLGTAYAGGLGIERSLVAAIRWWSRAAESGVPQAEDAVARLRWLALGRGRHVAADRVAAEDAFREYRAGLWREFPELTAGADESVGGALIAQQRVAEGLAVLLREANALGEPAQRRLVEIYERGVDGALPAFDARILAWLRTASTEGQARPRIGLARVYAGGLGVPKDVPRALALLRQTPHEDAQRLLQELSTARQD
jgi:TPR repeat protein